MGTVLDGRLPEQTASGSPPTPGVLDRADAFPSDQPQPRCFVEITGDIAWMVPRNDDAPLILWHEAGLSADLAGRPNLLASLVSPEHVGAGVRWIRQDTEHPRMGQSPPEQFAIPGTAIRPTRKAKA